MSCNHGHQECCKHEDIKFCPKCNKPYCVDCGKEWFDECKLNHYYWTYPYASPWYQSAETVSGLGSLAVTYNPCTHPA